MSAHLFSNSLGALAVGRQNNFNLLRMVAASLVLFSHSYALTGHITDEPVALLTGRHTDAATVGVTMFFGISGFLITQSIWRNQSVRAFLAARALRLIPGLLFSAVFTVVVIGWICTDRSGVQYWQSTDTWRFLWSNAMLSLGTQPSLPGVFTHNPVPTLVNGSLWTIPVEIWCYVAVGIAGVTGLLHRKFSATLCLLAAFWIGSQFPELVKPIWPMDARMTTVQLIGAFAVGSWLFLMRDWIPCSLTLASVLLSCLVLSGHSPALRYLYFCGIPYIVLVLAYHPVFQAKSYLRLGDYSYGTYVLAFPIQQFVVSQFAGIQPLEMLGLTLLATLPLAAFSWHFIEEPALSLKRRFAAPARRVATVSAAM